MSSGAGARGPGAPRRRARAAMFAGGEHPDCAAAAAPPPLPWQVCALVLGAAATGKTSLARCAARGGLPPPPPRRRRGAVRWGDEGLWGAASDAHAVWALAGAAAPCLEGGAPRRARRACARALVRRPSPPHAPPLRPPA